jgi:hypothetical protein
MARMARGEMVPETEVGVYHCVQRAVRRAFLCGEDAATGKNFDHRKEWIRARLEYLAGQFGIEVLSFAVMSNHLHVILRNRPDVVAGWSDAEVARRWWYLFPQRKDANGDPEEPTDTDLQMLATDPDVLAERRSRLSSISWLMRCLAEPIARRANREDHCTGRFWEGRFKCQRLLDETAILACSVYVDLNPIRAAVAETPESSEYTSAHERIHAGDEPTIPPEPQEHIAGRGTTKRKPKRRLKPLRVRDDWLSPVELNEKREHEDSGPVRRASSRGFLPMNLRQYLQLLDWTGRQLRPDKRGAIPADVAPILERLQLSGETWVDLIENFGRWFRRAAGTAESLAQEAVRRGQGWMHGVSHGRVLAG